MDALLETATDEPTQDDGGEAGGGDWQPPDPNVPIDDDFDAWWGQQYPHLDPYGVTVTEIKEFFGLDK